MIEIEPKPEPLVMIFGSMEINEKLILEIASQREAGLMAGLKTHVMDAPGGLPSRLVCVLRRRVIR